MPGKYEGTTREDTVSPNKHGNLVTIFKLFAFD